MNKPYSIQPFEQFLASLSSVKYREMREQRQLKPDNEAFDEMREFLLNRYEGVEVQHSFLERGGETVDCIPVEQQPSLRNGSEIPVPPSDPPAPEPNYPGDAHSAPGPTKHLPPQLHPDYYDPLGNQMWCPPGTIPMLRHTLDQLATDYSTIDGLLRGAKRADEVRRHAEASQEGDNLGGSSYINIWTPQLITPTLLSSASQQWYSNAGLPFVDLQTVECGWRAGIIEGAPADSLPRLFVFYTRKDYRRGESCYNDYCPNGFAYATGANHMLHGALSPTSQQGGDQYDLGMGFTLTQGRWWFQVGGTWIGSYPASLFANGTLGNNARLASFGGETTTGFGLFPAMGSGRFPTEGYSRAAYQRLAAVNDMSGVLRTAQLTPQRVSPSCYNVFVTITRPAPGEPSFSTAAQAA